MSSKIEQEECPRCKAYARLADLEIIRSGIFAQVLNVESTWICLKCGDTFRVSIPVFEVTGFGRNSPPPVDDD